MVVCNECIKNVLNRIFLEWVARYGEPPQIYWDAIHALEQLDKTCLTVNSTSDPNSPIGWRRNNYPILIVGKKNNKLKFSYTKKRLNNGDILIMVEEIADVYGNILTENNNNNNIKNMKQVIRLTESDLHRVIKESVNNILSELDWKTYKTAANKIRDKKSEYVDGEGDFWNYNERRKDDYAKKLDNSFYDLYDAARDSLEKQFGYEDETGSLCFPILGRKGHLSFSVAMLDANRNLMEYPYNEASKNLIDAYRRAKFELENFNDPHSQTVYPNTPSNYEYKRGEGWIKK